MTRLSLFWLPGIVAYSPPRTGPSLATLPSGPGLNQWMDGTQPTSRSHEPRRSDVAHTATHAITHLARCYAASCPPSQVNKPKEAPGVG